MPADKAARGSPGTLILHLHTRIFLLYFEYQSTFKCRNEHQNLRIMKNKRLVGILIAIALLLLIPFVAMQFTQEVTWSLFDFVVAGTLLLTTGLLCELVIRKVRKVEYRVAICVTILIALVLIWAELAVGLFGTPIAGS